MYPINFFLSTCNFQYPVSIDSRATNFDNLHHLFFIVRKLLKEVLTSNQISAKEDSKSANYLFEGGFLYQPCFDNLPDGPNGNSGTIVDLKSWEKFSLYLSAVIWPSIAKCLEDGKVLINSKACQVFLFQLVCPFSFVYFVAVNLCC